MTARRIKGTTPALVAGRVAPREIQLWRAGDNPTDYGVHVWNDRSIAEVLARYNERGNPLLIDVEHNGPQLEDGKPAPTGGYARLEVRARVPWLVFDWSDLGREEVETGQRRFLSPEYDVDKNTGEILALYRVSLVAEPGTHRARMLAASKKEGRMDISVILAAIRAALAAEDPAVAKESLINLLAEIEKTVGGEPSGDTPAETIDPVSTESDPPNPDDENRQMAAAKPAGSTTTKVAAAADDAVRTIQNATRDHILEIHGGKLDPSIRRWASAQPLEVVRGLLDATPAKDVAKDRAKATRGDGTSDLTERELKKCKARGIDPAKYAATKAAMTGG